MALRAVCARAAPHSLVSRPCAAGSEGGALVLVTGGPWGPGSMPFPQQELGRHLLDEDITWDCYPCIYLCVPSVSVSALGRLYPQHAPQPWLTADGPTCRLTRLAHCMTCLLGLSLGPGPGLGTEHLPALTVPCAPDFSPGPPTDRTGVPSPRSPGACLGVLSQPGRLCAPGAWARLVPGL